MMATEPTLRSPHPTFERAALALATVLTAFALYEVPSWEDALTDVCHQAAIFAVVTIAVMYVTRLLGSRGIALERAWAMLFLAGMPLVYIASWLLTKGAGTSVAWLAIEIVALPVYAGLAVLGLRRSPWFLAVGIVAHGVAWDAWHYWAGTPYIPTWYAVGCLLADVGLGAYLASRVPVWQAWGQRFSSQPMTTARYGVDASYLKT